MKKIINLLLLTAFMAACACNPSSEQTPQDKSADPSQDVSPTEQSLDPAPATTYKFVASALKEKWSAGDQIYVHGSLGSRAEVITLEDSQISEDGKTATVSLGAVTQNLKDPDGLYAAFPDEAVLHVKGVTGTKTTFTTSSKLLCVAYLKDDTFTFTDASSYISFSVQGDFDHFAFAAGNRDGMEATKYEIDYTSATSKFSVKSKDGDPYLTKSVVSGNKVRVWLPGGTTIKGGITIYFIKDEEKVMMYKTSDDVKIKMGEGLDLGDITSSIEPYDGSAPVMPVMGEMTKYSVKFDELSGLCLSKDGDFLWAVGDQGELAKISIDGKLENKVTIKTGTAEQSWSVDAEGVTVNPETGDLIISAEANSVVRIPAADLDGIFEDKTYYGVKEMFHISAASDYGNSGTEGCTYYKDGKIYVGAQTDAHLFCCDVATSKVLWDKRLRKVFPAISEIAGLSYDPVKDWLWIVDSETHMFYAITGDAEAYLGAYSMKNTDNPEAICFDRAHGCIWVGDDAGSTSYIYKYSFTGL